MRALIYLGLLCSMVAWPQKCASLGYGPLQYRPWYPEPLLPVGTLAYQLQTFPRIASSPYALERGETAHQMSGGLSLSFTDRLNAQGDVSLAETTVHGFFFDHATVALRYLVLNDVIGDPMSVSLGGALVVPSTTSLRDFATPYLGPIQLQAHIAIGKERTYHFDWIRRAWWVGALTASTKGRPTLWTQLAVAFHRCSMYQLEFFSLGLLGLGGRSLSTSAHFEGYGPYAVRAIDVGIRLVIGSWGEYSGARQVRLEYRYRPYAHNYPENAHFIVLSLVFPLAI